MSSPYVGEIRMFGGNFAPVGWAFCEGQLIAISENDVLFTLIGTTYGGDGESTFGLPDLRARIPVHTGPGYTLAQTGGVEAVTLTTQQMTSHNHPMVASENQAGSTDPTNNVAAVLPVQTNRTAYGTDPPTGQISGTSIAPAGGSQPHNNFQPYLVVNFIISLYGLFPNQT